MIHALTIATALGCALIAGVFFAFSAFVMRALDRLPAVQAAAAMQSINVVVLNPLFLGVFLGTGTGCAVLAIASWTESLRLAGCLLYLGGTVLVTGLCNVPRNNRLAAEGANVWPDYVRSWTRWNHVRTATALAAAALLLA